MHVAVILPAYNEEKGIALTITDLKKLKVACEIVVADNGSTDNTAEVVRGLGIVPLFVPDKGKGCAVRAALQVVSADYIFMMDSDHTYPSSYLPGMLNLLKNDYEVVMGKRDIINLGAMSALHKLGNKGISLLASTLYAHHVSDLCTGMWGFRGYVAKALQLHSKKFTLEAELFCEIMERHYKLAEIPIRYDVRAGEAHLKVKDGVDIGLFLLKRRLRLGGLLDAKSTKI